jgi:Tfp pilus assembly protein PilX
MRRAADSRNGSALAMVIVVIAIVSALIAGGFLSSTLQARMGANTLTQVRALSAAEFGQDSAYSEWNKKWNAYKAGTTFVRAYASGDGSVDTVRVTKLNGASFLLVSQGQAGKGLRAGARRRTALLLRLATPKINALGALTSRGTVKIGGSAAISGKDTSLTGWGCPPAGAATAGVSVPSSTNLSVGGTCSGLTCIQGNPLVNVTPAAADTNTYFNYGTTD